MILTKAREIRMGGEISILGGDLGGTLGELSICREMKFLLESSGITTPGGRFWALGGTFDPPPLYINIINAKIDFYCQCIESLNFLNQ